uniref:DNA circularization N-terminal domain-containing protein n=1 Tax=Rahnella sp. ChDrAdgB13 TaxID=1850581 RepID=UPI001AD89242
MSDLMSQLAALAGIDTLQPASFRGVAFECLDTRDTISRDTATYAYPYQDGTIIEDQGLKALNFRMTAFLFGSDWKQQLKALLTTFKTSGPGELIHPVHGSIPRAQFLEAGIEKQVEPLDAVTIELVFLESGTEQALFSSASADQATESISGTGDSLLDNAASAFSTAMSD